MAPSSGSLGFSTRLSHEILSFLWKGQMSCGNSKVCRWRDIKSWFLDRFTSPDQVWILLVCVFEKGCDCNARGIQQRCSVRSYVLTSVLPFNYWVEQQRVIDNALRLVPDSPTVCLGVNETTRKGEEGAGKKGRKEGKRDRKKGTRGRKSNCFIGCNIESSRCSTKKRDVSAGN